MSASKFGQIEFGHFRVLVVPSRDITAKDERGRSPGDDWEVGSTGGFDGPDGKYYHAIITTNGVHASEYGYVVPDALKTAQILAHALNAAVERGEKAYEPFKAPDADKEPK